MAVEITVEMACGHTLTYIGSIEEKYPFYCDTCDEPFRDGKYPWSLTTKEVPDTRP